MAEVWGAVISAAVTVGTTAYAYASAPGAPKPPNLASASRAGIEAESATLADRRRLEAAAQQGGTTDYQTAGHKEKTDAIEVFKRNTENNLEGQWVSAGWVPYKAEDWKAGGQYFDDAKYKQGHRKVHEANIPGGTRTADFTGFGEADVKGSLARQNAQNILDLEKKYGPQFIEEALKEQELADPEGTAARRLSYELIQKQIEDKPQRPVADLLQKQISDQLAAGKGLDAISSDVLNDAVGKSLRDRGETSAPSGEALDFSQPLTTGFEGEARRQAGQDKALAWLTSGATPEDVAYRREQQNLSSLSAFVNGRTPESQFETLSGAQQGPAPYNQGRPLAQPNQNAGPAMAGAQMQGWNTAMTGAENTANPWMAGLSALLKGASAAGNGGFKPLATNV